MLDAKSFGIALVTVFLSTALGLVLGVGWTVAGLRIDESVLDRLDEEVAGLAQERRIILREREELRVRITQSEQVMRSIRPSLIDGRLSGRAVGLVLAGPGLGDPELEVTLKESGAVLSWIITVVDPLALDWAVLAQALLPGGRHQLDDLQSQGLIQYSGKADPDPKAIMVVLASNRDTVLARSGTSLVRVLTATGLRVVAAERSDSHTGLEDLKRHAQATVDNIDEVAGQMAAVVALADRDGSFGRKSGTTRIRSELRAR